MSIPLAVIGGGIGGAAATLSLLAHGIDAHLFEKADRPNELGAGLQLSPNATRVLQHLGLSRQLRAKAVEPAAWHQRRWDTGKTLSWAPLSQNVMDRFGYPYFHILRADLLKILMDAIPPERVHFDHELTGLTQFDHSVDLKFTNGQTVNFAGAIGADGIKSKLRDIMFGPSERRYSGCVAYRGLIKARDLKSLDIKRETQVWLGPRRHLVTYYVAGGDVLNYVAVVDQEHTADCGWIQEGDVKRLRQEFAGWHPSVEGLLQATQMTFYGGIFDCLPLETWTKDNATLLGDACHSIMPFMAQGAGQAIEDAAVLGRCLERADKTSIARCFGTYEAKRKPRTHKIWRLSAGLQKNLHLGDGPDQAERDQALACDESGWRIGDLNWLYGHNALAS